MKRLLFIGFAACTLALAPGLASAMPVATPGAFDGAVIQVKGGHGHGGGHGWGHGGDDARDHITQKATTDPRTLLPRLMRAISITRAIKS
jgi:hypothetical protein